MAVSVGAKPARAKATPVSLERFMMPAGYGGAWPGFETTRSATHSNTAPPVWRAPEGPEGLAAVPVGGGRARAGLEIDHSEPQARVWRSRGRPGPTAPGTPAEPQATSSIANSGCAAGVEGAGGSGGHGRASRSTTPSAARVWRSRGRAAAHRHTQRPGPKAAQRSARNTSGATSNNTQRGRLAGGQATRRPGPTAPRTPTARQTALTLRRRRAPGVPCS